jgi:hypothetical protein
MKKLDDRFKGGKSTSKDMLDVYFETLCEIPNQVFKYIIKQIILYQKTYPTPGEILGLWTEWQRQHPEKIIKNQAKTECMECDGKGWIEYLKIDEMIRREYLFIAKCARCDNYGFARGVPVMTKEALRRKGYEIVGDDRPTLTEEEPERDLEKLSNQATHSMEDEIPF